MPLWNRKTPRKHDEFRKWHKIADTGILWRVRGVPPLLQIELKICGYCATLDARCASWTKAEERIQLFVVALTRKEK